MTLTLRPYQQQSVDLGVSFLHRSSKKNGIIVLPTGSGKSLCIASTVKQLDGPSLVFQPSKEILEQNEEKMIAYGYTPSVFSASAGRREVGDITLATIGSVARTPELFQDVQYILIDECHLVSSIGFKDDEKHSGMYASFLEALPHTRIMGYTASPYRLSTDNYGGSILKFLTRTRPRVFQEVVHYVQNRELFAAGYLSPLQYFTVKGLDRARLKVNSAGSDYTDRSVQMHFHDIGFESKLERVVHRLLEIGRRNVLVFTRFVDEAHYLVSRIPGSEIVTAETPKPERERIIKGFRSGAIKVVANVGVLGTGFDYPELETVVLARPTMSLNVYYQQVGRVVRPHPLKEYGMVVDMAGLQEQFGRVEDLHLNPNGGKWQVETSGKPLTNVYFGQPQNFQQRKRA